jgi:hypothetical protein
MFDNLIRRDPREQWKDDRQCPADPSKQRWRSRERAARAVRLPAGELDELIPRGTALVGDGIQHVAQLASRTLLVKTGHAIRSRAGFGLACCVSQGFRALAPETWAREPEAGSISAAIGRCSTGYTPRSHARWRAVISLPSDDG